MCAARLGVPRLSMLRTPLGSERTPALTLAGAAATRPALALRPPMRLAVTLAEELADGGIPVGGQSMHAIARLDAFRLRRGVEVRRQVAGRSGLSRRSPWPPIALAVAARPWTLARATGAIALRPWTLSLSLR